MSLNCRQLLKKIGWTVTSLSMLTSHCTSTTVWGRGIPLVFPSVSPVFPSSSHRVKLHFRFFFENNSGNSRCGGTASFPAILHWPLVLLPVLVGVYYISISTITSTASDASGTTTSIISSSSSISTTTAAAAAAAAATTTTTKTSKSCRYILYNVGVRITCESITSIIRKLAMNVMRERVCFPALKSFKTWSL